jgi:hypothetical protein
MHYITKPPPLKPAPPEREFAILTLEGVEVDVAPTYYLALMRGYQLLKCGRFTVEPKFTPVK